MMLMYLNTKKKLRRTSGKVQRLNKASDVTEAIASKDHNNLYITSSFFKDHTKYKAFCAYYAIMRIVDDRVDNIPLFANRGKKLIEREQNIIDAWERVIKLCHRGKIPTASQLKACDFDKAEAVCESFTEAIQIIPTPIKLWENFFNAMRSDINANKFECWSDFLNYAEGATVAPTTIYLLLIAAEHNNANNVYELPTGFDLFKCGRYLGIFAYLGHIIRDLAEDIKHAERRICITREDLVEYNITLERLRNEALRQKISASTRDLVIEILQRARNYLFKGRSLTSQIQHSLDLDCRFILELIIRMYEQIISKIESTDFNPMGRQHYLTRKEKISIIHSVAADTDFSLPGWVSD